MKIGVLSDTHIPHTMPSLPARIHELFKGADLILHAGDIVDLSVLDELKLIAPVEAVSGNMDGPKLHRVLPAKKVLSLVKFRVGLIHGKFKIPIQREMIRKEFDQVDLIVYGHSHMPFWGVEQGVRFLNPGSPTDNVHVPYHSVAILHIDDTIEAEIVRL